MLLLFLLCYSTVIMTVLFFFASFLLYLFTVLLPPFIGDFIFAFVIVALALNPTLILASKGGIGRCSNLSFVVWL